MSRFRFILIILLVTSLGGAIVFELSGKKTVTLDSTQWTENKVSPEDPALRPEFPLSADETEPGSTFLEILPSDCQNECTSFVSEPDKERYCRNVCGLATETPGDDSDSTVPYQESIERKDAAIKNQDLGACSEIKDTNLRKSCEVRVTEDLLG